MHTEVLMHPISCQKTLLLLLLLLLLLFIPGFLIELGVHYDPIREAHPKESFVKQFTFNSKRKSMSTVVPLPNGKGYRLLTKGASEIVLSKCSKIMTSYGEVRAKLLVVIATSIIFNHYIHVLYLTITYMYYI